MLHCLSVNRDGLIRYFLAHGRCSVEISAGDLEVLVEGEVVKVVICTVWLLTTANARAVEDVAAARTPRRMELPVLKHLSVDPGLDAIVFVHVAAGSKTDGPVRCVRPVECVLYTANRALGGFLQVVCTSVSID